MRKASVFLVMAFFLFSASMISAQEAPVAISPGSEMGIAKVGTVCPTFSWTAVDWASAYRVEVYPASESMEVTHNMVLAQAHPLIVKEIPGAATSWTPSSDQCLVHDGTYVWYVQAIDAYGNGAWSQGRVFRVEAGPGYTAIEEKLGKTLEEHGVDKKIIGDVVEELKAEVINDEGNLAVSADIATPIRVQGNESGSNTYYGESAGFSLTAGTNNTFVGYQSGYSTASGFNNSFFGYHAGNANTAGFRNVFIGSYAGVSNFDAWGNTFVGHQSGYSNTTGIGNTFLGAGAGFKSNSSCNVFLGGSAGYHNTSGSENVFVGAAAGDYNTTGINNVYVGHVAGRHNVSGSANLFLGWRAGHNETGSNKLYIDNSDTSDPLIWGDFENNILSFMGTVGVGTKSPAYPLEMKKTGTNASMVVDRTDGATNYINATATSGNFGTVTNHVLRFVVGGLWAMRLHTDYSLTMRNGASCTIGGVWTNASSRDLKDDINDLSTEQAIEALNDLQPVTYKYKADMEDEHVGFIAEDVPDLVASKDRKGMSPMDVVAVLTKVVQEQQKTIAGLKQEIAELKTSKTEK